MTSWRRGCQLLAVFVTGFYRLPGFVLFKIAFKNLVVFANFVSVCKRNDPELSKCFINSVNEIRPYLIEGIPEMDLPQGEPLQYFDTKSNNNLGLAQLAIRCWNQTIYGLMNFDLRSIHLDFKNVRCNTSVFFPKLRLTGKYSFKGNLLLFDLDTIGDYDINTTNVLANVEFIGRYYTKKSQQYIEFNEVDLKLDIGKTQLYFDNVVDGNKELTETVNLAINENSESIITEFGPVLHQIYGDIIQLYFNSVFRLYSVETLFPSE